MCVQPKTFADTPLDSIALYSEFDFFLCNGDAKSGMLTFVESCKNSYGRGYSRYGVFEYKRKVPRSQKP